MKKIAIALFFLMCLTSVFLPTLPIPTGHSPSTTTALPSVSPELLQSSVPTPLIPRTVRVAIYDEPNLTAPTYATEPGQPHNNASGLETVLLSYGITVTRLDVHDIYNHRLLTADYDVLALVDNFPRENITNQVMEFWLGGGGLLVLDGAAGFLCHFGILPPEALGTDGRLTYWDYSGLDINITARHPVSKSFNIGDVLDHPLSGYLRWEWSALLGSVIAGDLTRVARSNDDPDTASVLAFDPTDHGGKIVTIAHDFYDTGMAGLNQLIADAIDWLCPRPKARVLYDLSHIPYYGVDPWDTMTTIPQKYSTLRAALVNRSYTFDKLWPSPAGNLTAANLTPYDILIAFLPQVNYTAVEVTAVTDWITGGGALLGLGDNALLSDIRDWNDNLNYLFSNLDLRMNNTASGSLSPIAQTWPHPTLEPGLTQLTTSSFGYVNFSGPAVPIWGEDAGDIVVGAQDYGSGRALLLGDVNPFDNSYIDYTDNYQFAINVFNWLSAASADVLLYVDENPGPPDPNDNLYRSPVAQALNDLDVSFYLTFDAFYFNMSLAQGPWNLVVIDNPYRGNLIPTYTDDILDYAKTGGRLILSTWEYITASNQLWRFMGLNVTDANWFSTPPTIYTWDPTHDIFTQPNYYAANNMSDVWNFVSRDCYNVTVLANGTAIAGLGASPSTVNATLILGNGGQTIANTMLLTSYFGDTDDSTYSDALEIWENEIAFMLRPVCGFSPTVTPPVNQGSIVNIQLDIDSRGLRPAFGGWVTLSVPAALGHLEDAATKYFATPLGPGGSDSVSWQLNVTGIGYHILTFTAGYDGFPGTTYSDGFFVGTTAWGTFDVTPAFSPGTTVTQGDFLDVDLTVLDGAGSPVTDALIDSTIDTTTVSFTHAGGGVYGATITTGSLSPATYTLSVDVEKFGFVNWTDTYSITVQSNATTPITPTTPTTPTGIPGFPPLAIAIGAAIAVSVGIIARRRKR